jgi:hypothetical protein
MHVDHARVPLQRVVRTRLDTHDVARIAARLAKPHEMITQESGLFGVEETVYDEIAVLVEAALGGGVDHMRVVA